MPDDFSKIEPWIMGLMARLSASQRRSLARRIGQQLRRSNAARIAANQQPDGSAMERRKPRVRRDGDRVRKKGRMFKKISLARNMKIDAKADGVALAFSGAVRRTAEVHHFGKRDRVARFRGAPEVQYPARALMGFGDGDDDAIMQAVLDHLDRTGN
ncbi:MAG: phage virion morphogenesis protein [Pseudomonadota bacterium]